MIEWYKSLPSDISVSLSIACGWVFGFIMLRLSTNSRPETVQGMISGMAWLTLGMIGVAGYWLWKGFEWAFL